MRRAVIEILTLTMLLCGCQKDADLPNDAPHVERYDAYVLAASFEEDGSCTLVSGYPYRIEIPITEDHPYLESYNVYPAVFHVPEQIGGHPVTRIAEGGLQQSEVIGHFSVIEALYLPDSLQSIDRRGIHRLPIRVLSVGQNLTEIEPGGLCEMDRLETVEIRGNNPRYTNPEGKCLYDQETNTLIMGTVSGYIPQETKQIGEYAFMGKRNLGSFVIPQGIERIHAYAFAYCDGLTEIIIPDSVTEIGECVFLECHDLTRIRGGSYTEIPSTMITNDYELTEFVVPRSVSAIRKGGLTNLSTHAIYIPSSVETIEAGALWTASDAVLYCEAAEQPEGWQEGWYITEGWRDGSENQIEVVWNAKMPD